MSALFMDTAFILAVASPKDALYQRAVAWRYALRGPFITSEFVMLEVADGMANHRFRSVAQDIIMRLKNDPTVIVIPADELLLQAGFELYCRHFDKDWGLTDCISFEIMQSRKLTDALTYDHHFEQAGFRALLRTDPPSN